MSTYSSQKRSQLVQLNAFFIADLSYQTWLKRALAEPKYPREVANWWGERYEQQFLPTTDKTTSIKTWQNWKEGQRRCRRSNYKFWFRWISNRVDQWQLHFAHQNRCKGCRGLLCDYWAFSSFIWILWCTYTIIVKEALTQCFQVFF